MWLKDQNGNDVEVVIVGGTETNPAFEVLGQDWDDELSDYLWMHYGDEIVKEYSEAFISADPGDPEELDFEDEA